MSGLTGGGLGRVQYQRQPRVTDATPGATLKLQYRLIGGMDGKSVIPVKFKVTDTTPKTTPCSRVIDASSTGAELGRE